MIALVGFMGAGKTTVGRLLAERLGAPFTDSDELIEQRLGRSIRSVFEDEGEAYFRDIECAVVTELVQGDAGVVALGGGAVEDARTRDALRAARVVYLTVGYEEALARTKDDARRPMLHRPGLSDLFARRLSVYEDLAAIAVPTDGRPPSAIAADVFRALTEPCISDPPGSLR